MPTLWLALSPLLLGELVVWFMGERGAIVLLEGFAVVPPGAAFETVGLPVAEAVVVVDIVVKRDIEEAGVEAILGVAEGRIVVAEVETPTVPAICTPPCSQHVLFPHPQQ